MDPTAVCPDKAFKQFIMPLFSYKFDIPQGMIQDHQNTRQFIEQSEHFGQPLGGMIFLIKGVTEERVGKLLCSGLGKVMNTYVEKAVFEGNCPFHRDRCL